MFPIPKHLKDILKLTGNDNNEFKINGKIVCECGCEKFTIKIVGDDADYNSYKVIRVADIEGFGFLIIKIKCNNCDKKYLVFDNDYHGWNGFVCGGDNREEKRPKTRDWHCNKCQKTDHSLMISIYSEGQEDFIEEAGDQFDKEDWTEAFGSINLKVDCNVCGGKNDEWLSYETM